MTREIKTESRFFGPDVQVVYEDGEKVGEIHVERRWFGPDVKVEYDLKDNKVSETCTERTFLGSNREVTENARGERISETWKETSLLGSPIEVTYDTSGNKVSVGRYRNQGRIKIIEDVSRRERESPEDIHSSDSGLENSSDDYVYSSLPRREGKTHGVGCLLLAIPVAMGIIALKNPSKPARDQAQYSIPGIGEPSRSLEEKVKRETVYFPKRDTSNYSLNAPANETYAPLIIQLDEKYSPLVVPVENRYGKLVPSSVPYSPLVVPKDEKYGRLKMPKGNSYGSLRIPSSAQYAPLKN